MKQHHLITLILFFLFPCKSLFAQQTITGKVVDAASRQPLEYVLVKGQQPGSRATTDLYGRFSISTKSKEDSLILSCAGYKKFINTYEKL